LDDAVDVANESMEGVALLNNACDRGHQQEDNGEEKGREKVMRDPMPADDKIACPQDSLRKYEIDDNNNDHTRGEKDIRGDEDRDGGLMGGPDNPQYTARGAGHGEAKKGSGGKEFVTPLAVELEDGHVGCGAEDK
jgi:hypothetical protein